MSDNELENLFVNRNMDTSDITQCVLDRTLAFAMRYNRLLTGEHVKCKWPMYIDPDTVREHMTYCPDAIYIMDQKNNLQLLTSHASKNSGFCAFHNRYLEKLPTSTLQPWLEDFRRVIMTANVHHSDGLCAICLDSLEFEQDIMMLPCHATHQFHRECVMRYLNNKENCPTCPQGPVLT